MAYGFDPGMLSGRDSAYAMGANRPEQALMSPQPANFGNGGFTPPAWNPQWLQANQNRFMRNPGRGFGARQQLPVQGYDPATQRAMFARMNDQLGAQNAYQYGFSQNAPLQGLPQNDRYQAPQNMGSVPQGMPQTVQGGGAASQAWGSMVNNFQGMPQFGFTTGMAGSGRDVPNTAAPAFSPQMSTSMQQDALRAASAAAGGPGVGGMVPMYQNGQLSMQRPYDPGNGYQNVGGFYMAPGAQNFNPTPMDLGQMANAFGSQDISGRALETGQTQKMATAQALGTSLSNLNVDQVRSPEVLALLQQLAKEAQYEQAYGQPMYAPMPYDSRTVGG